MNCTYSPNTIYNTCRRRLHVTCCMKTVVRNSPSPVTSYCNPPWPWHAGRRSKVSRMIQIYLILTYGILLDACASLGIGWLASYLAGSEVCPRFMLIEFPYSSTNSSANPPSPPPHHQLPLLILCSPCREMSTYPGPSRAWLWSLPKPQT